VSDERVLLAKDAGSRDQWAIGKLFYRKEGGKQRANMKPISLAVFAAFGTVMVIGLLRDSPEQQETSASPIKAPVDIKETTNIDMEKMTLFVKPKFEQVTHLRSVSGDSKQVSIRYAGLEKVAGHMNIKIPPGSMAEAVLTSGASDGPIRAVLTEDLVAGGSRLVKQGTTLVGEGISNENRLSVKFRYLVFQDGTHVRVEADGCDISDRMPGLLGSNVRGQALKLSGALGLGMLGGTAIGLQKKQTQGVVSDPSMRDALLNGVATAALEQAQSLTSNLKSTTPLYQVPEGQKFYVLFAGDDR
jgi:hypothetical protein